MSSSIRAPLPPGIPATRTRVEQEILKAIDAASEAQERKGALCRLALFYHEQANRSDLAGAVFQLMIQEFDDPLENPYSGSQVHIDRGVLIAKVLKAQLALRDDYIKAAEAYLAYCGPSAHKGKRLLDELLAARKKLVEAGVIR
jgi:hypothetical protein